MCMQQKISSVGKKETLGKMKKKKRRSSVKILELKVGYSLVMCFSHLKRASSSSDIFLLFYFECAQRRINFKIKMKNKQICFRK